MIKIMPNGDNIIAEDIVTLTESQRQKLECSSLAEKVDALCKDLHIESWEVRNNGNVATHAIMCEMDRYDDETQNRLGRTHHEFLQAIDKMELSKPLPEQNKCEAVNQDDVRFVKQLLEEYESEPRTVGAALMAEIPGIPITVESGMISTSLLKDLLVTYLERYDK